MGQQIDLLRGLPRGKRNLQARKDGKSAEVVRISNEFGEMYFDGPGNTAMAAISMMVAGCRSRAISPSISD
jgi:hypothetical protein